MGLVQQVGSRRYKADALRASDGWCGIGFASLCSHQAENMAYNEDELLAEDLDYRDFKCLPRKDEVVVG